MGGSANQEIQLKPAPLAPGIRKVLIIDDEPDTVTFLSTWLEDHGYEVCTAGDGEEGLHRLKAERPALVLMDLKMPRRTGIQLYREICQNCDFGPVPVVFITGLPEFQVFDGHCTPLPEPAGRIDKPIDLEALSGMIKQLIG